MAATPSASMICFLPWIAGTSATASSRAIPSVQSKEVTVRRLLKPAPPVPGESLRGLVADACARNHIPNTWGILQHFGLLYRNRVDVSEAEALNISGLATALRIDEREVTSRRYPPLGRLHRSFYGLQLFAGRIEDRQRRFSPAAIAAGHRHHPVTHELRDLPFSLVGWDLLQNACPCEEGGARQGWTRTNGTARCDCCGGRLDRIDPILVPDDLRTSLSLLAGMVDPNEEARAAELQRLPEEIRHSNRALLFDVTVALSDCALAAAAGLDFSPLDRVRALSLACEALLDWPRGLGRFKSSVTTRDDRLERAQRNYLSLYRCPEAPVEASGERRSSDPKQPALGAAAVYLPAGRCGRVIEPYISALAAARLTGVDEPALKAAWDAGLLSQHSRVQGTKQVRAFHPEEVVAVAPRLRRAKPRARVAARLGLTVFGIEQLAALGIFCPATPGGEQNQWDVHLAEAHRLTAKVAERARESISDPMPLLEAVRHISGRPKPWGPIVAALIDGTISFALKDDQEMPLMRRVVIRQDDLERIKTLAFERSSYPDESFEPRWVQQEALDCLNGYQNASELLEGLASTGERPKWYAAEEVEALARQGVTTSDIARRAQMSVMRAYMVLDKAHTKQIAEGLWDRKAAEALLLG